MAPAPFSQRAIKGRRPGRDRNSDGMQPVITVPPPKDVIDVQLGSVVFFRFVRYYYYL